MERFNTFRGGDVVWAGTYNGNQVVVAAALATLELLADGEVHKHINKLGSMMRDGLAELAAGVSVPACVCGYGSLFALCFMAGPVECYEDVARNDVEVFVRYRRELIARGVFEFPDTDGTRSHIGAAHTTADIATTLEIAAQALNVTLSGASVT